MEAWVRCGYVAGVSFALLKDCPKAPAGPEPDPVLRRVKAVLNHPIGDYAVQVSYVIYMSFAR